MQIRDKTVEEFKRLYKEEFGEELTVSEAQDVVFRLVHLYLKLAEPLPDRGEQSDDKAVAS